MTAAVTCALCGAPVVFAKSPAGETVTLDTTARVFQLSDSVVEPLAILAPPETWVAHGAVCKGLKKATQGALL